MKFGEIDKKDFLIPPFVFFYFYLIFANAFHWPTIPHQVIFHQSTITGVGVILCLLGLIIFWWSIISFRKSFRVGIDEHQADELITTSVLLIAVIRSMFRSD